MTGNLFPDPNQPTDEAADAQEPAKPALAPAPDRRRQLLDMLGLALGLEPLGRTITAFEQDGQDPDDATYTVQLDDDTRVNLGTVATLMSRPKTQHILLVRLGASPAAMKAAEWQDTIATAIVGALTKTETAESLAARVAEWATQYLEREPPSPDRDTACLAREPYKDDQGRIHLVLTKLSKYIARTSTEQLTERKLAAALRDNAWEPATLHYYPSGDGKGKRSTVSYYRAPADADGPK